MQMRHASTLIRAALTVMFLAAAAGPASADSILLSNVQVNVDQDTLTADVTAGLEAFSSTGGDVFLEGLSVSLFEDGQLITDLVTGPPRLDDLPFLLLPYPLADHTVLPDSTLLFSLTDLTAGALYTGTFILSDANGALASADFSFRPVPEPGTMSLLAIGGGLAWSRKWCNRKAKANRM